MRYPFTLEETIQLYSDIQNEASQLYANFPEFATASYVQRWLDQNSALIASLVGHIRQAVKRFEALEYVKSKPEYFQSKTAKACGHIPDMQIAQAVEALYSDIDLEEFGGNLERSWTAFEAVHGFHVSFENGHFVSHLMPVWYPEENAEIEGKDGAFVNLLKTCRVQLDAMRKLFAYQSELAESVA